MTTKPVPLLIAVCLLSACTTPAPKVTQSQMEMQSYQSREFDATKRQAFDSTLSVLQDSGFIIESANFDTGFMTGKGTTTSRFDLFRGVRNEHIKMTAFVEQRTSSRARIRINIVQSEQGKSAWNDQQEVINEKGVRDPQVYQELFEKIDQAVFIKKNL